MLPFSALSARFSSARAPCRRRSLHATMTFLSAWLWVAWVTAPVARGQLPFIEVDPNATTALREAKSGEPFVSVGVNYFGPHTGWAPKLWQQFDATEVRRHLQLIRVQGLNTIRVFLTQQSFHQVPGQVTDEGLEKFRRLVDMCRELEIRIIPSGPDHWEGTPEWRRKADAFADERILTADTQWWRQFTKMFADEPVILAWDLLNEPAVSWDSPAMRMKWSRWLQEKYGSIERVAEAHNVPVGQLGGFDSIDVPPKKSNLDDQRLFDYQQFRESIADAWTKRLVEAIRDSDRRHPITIGQIQWSGISYLPTVWHYSGFNLQQNSRHVDFVTIHFYPIRPPRPDENEQGIANNGEYLERLLYECCSAGKPVMIGEFAWYGGGEVRVGERLIMPRQTVEDQVAWNRKLLEVSRGRVCGWLHWATADTPSSHDLTRWSGLWTEDFELKAWGKVFGSFAREVTASPDSTRPFSIKGADDATRRRISLTDPSQVSWKPD
jgi:hypothetical protein